MQHSSFYENEARECLYKQFQQILNKAKKTNVLPLYVLSVPRGSGVSRLPNKGFIIMFDCIDVIVEGQAQAQKIANIIAKKMGQPVGGVHYTNQTVDALGVELNQAIAEAKENHKPYIIYW